MEEYGTIKIHLADLIEQAGISKNKLSHRGRALALAKEKWGALIAAAPAAFPR